MLKIQGKTIVFCFEKMVNASGGNERVLIDLCNHFSKSNNVILLTQDQEEGLAFFTLDERVKFYKKPIKSNLMSHALDSKFKEKLKALLFNLGLDYDFLKKQFFKLRVLRRPKESEINNEWGEFLNKEMVDVVVSSHPKTNKILLSLKKNKKINSKLIICFHEDPQHHFKAKGPWYESDEAVERVLSDLQEANKITLLWSSFKTYFDDKIKAKSVIIPNAAIDREAAREVVLRPQKEIIYVSRYDKYKNHLALVKAFVEVNKLHASWTLKLVGAGLKNSKVDKWIRDHKLEKIIQIVPPVKNIFQEYSTAQICVFPSLVDSWGLGISEAMALGLPAVGFESCAGASNLITHKKNGLLLPGEKPVDELVDSLNYLIANEEIRKEWGEQAKESMYEYSEKNVLDAWEHLLECTCKEVD